MVHQFAHRFQEKFISRMSKEVIDKIITEIKLSKYNSIHMDCTPDISHTEQCDIIIELTISPNNMTKWKNTKQSKYISMKYLGYLHCATWSVNFDNYSKIPKHQW